MPFRVSLYRQQAGPNAAINPGHLATHDQSLIQVAVNPVNGQLYGVFYDNPNGDDKADIMFVMSSDQGATWTAPQRVNDDAGLALQFKPAIAVAPDGKHLLVAFRDTRLNEATQLARFPGRPVNS